jgi:putative mRNA 3-end processing factor
MTYSPMAMSAPEDFSSWLRPDEHGLYCEPGGFHIDPVDPVARAIVTHAHSDHARPGLGAALATQETLDIMKIRLGEAAPTSPQPIAYGQPLKIGDVDVSLAPAGHILGAAQIVITYRGRRAVVSGDYKRTADPTCTAFELVPCDLFVSEATFGLPVFKHGDPHSEIAKLLDSLKAFPGRTHQVGVYGLGKCQRVIALLREAGYDRTIWLHGALRGTTDYYVKRGIKLGDLRPVADATDKLPGEIVLGPPSALGDLWSRRFEEPVTCLASGWMRVRGRARQRGVELPLVISDHADWPELLQTIEETGASHLWVTHGREEALVYAAEQRGLQAKALSLVGLEDEAE